MLQGIPELDAAGLRRFALTTGGIVAVADAILHGIQDPSTLPDPTKRQDAAMAAPGLAHMIHAARTGNPQALAPIGHMAEQMSTVGGQMAKLEAH